jgi:dinuclear metal center YbgI/SA1388 family protein
MVVSVEVLCQYIGKLLDVGSFDDICLNGLQVEGTRPISSFATAVTPSLFAIEEAKREKCELLLTHHGYFLKNMNCCLTGILGNRVRALIQNDLHLLSYHLPLDAHEEFGNAWPVFKELQCRALSPFGKISQKYFGVKGEISPISVQDLYSTLSTIFKNSGTFFGRKGDEILQSLAFLPGGGHRFLREAIESGVDCFITGTVDESTWHEAIEAGICVMVFGHSCTERRGIQLLGEHLAKTFSLSHFSIVENNPY